VNAGRRPSGRAGLRPAGIRPPKIGDLPEEFTLFDRPPDAPAPKIRVAKTAATDGKPAWQKYTGPEKCDECRQAQVRGELLSVASQAHYKRTGPGGFRRDLLLCYPHARQWREADGLDIPKGMQ
jgi:hypothetical protein